MHRLRPTVLTLREKIIAGRNRAHEMHNRAASSIKVCAKITSTVDEVVRLLFDETLASIRKTMDIDLHEHVALVAHGGYGRRHLAPYSDVDLMILHDGTKIEAVEELARRMTQDIFDVGLQLGQSVRTTAQAISLAKSDAPSCTSLIESRHLLGSSSLYETFWQAFCRLVTRRAATLRTAFIAARAEERTQFGETVYLLEPNVKRSRGALRDMHLLRWLWFAKHGESDPDRLHMQGILSKFEHRRLISSRNFLLAVRNGLHFHAESAQDTLSRSEQVRLAKQLGYFKTSGLLPVEKFMRDFFMHSRHIWFMTSRSCELSQPLSRMTRVLDPVLGKSVENDYRVGRQTITATNQGKEKLKHHLSESLRLVELARVHERRIDQETWYLVYRSAPDYKNELTGDIANDFMEILSRPDRLSELLRRLHEIGVLEKILPAFTHARSLLQFNQYHKYTIDEHCILAVQEAVSFAQRKDTIGEVTRSLKSPGVLHLALLLHDLGKGFDIDHSEKGREIAVDMCKRLQLSAEDSSMVEFLVHKHLRMPHLAFRRDISDAVLIEHFAKEVGTVERLKLLYLHTAADLSAVGPGVFNRWKAEVLTDLFERTLRVLQTEPVSGSSQRRMANQRDARRVQVWEHLPPELRTDPWFKQQFAAMPEIFLSGRAPEQIADALQRLSDTQKKSGVVWSNYLQTTRTTEFLVGVANGAGRGIFSAMAGALSQDGMKILSAETQILADGLLMLRYEVTDPRAPGELAKSLSEKVARTMLEAIESEEPPKFPKVWGSEQKAASKALTNLPHTVRLDCNLSEECVIVEVFTLDRRGLLYDLARALHNMELVIRIAKIGTHLDQVVDVFYVTERDCSKPTSEERLAEVTEKLQAIIQPEVD